METASDQEHNYDSFSRHQEGPPGGSLFLEGGKGAKDRTLIC